MSDEIDTPPFRNYRVAKRSLRLPPAERERVRHLAIYLDRICSDSGLKVAIIAERARQYVPTLSDKTVSRLKSPEYMVAQSGTSFLMIDAMLQSLGSNWAELERALSSDAAADTRADEQERALVHLFRSLPPKEQQFLLEDAQRYVSRLP